MDKKVMRFLTLACAIGVSLPTFAIDPFVYKDCLAKCKSFSGRTCCHETCSYQACIAENMKTNLGAGMVGGNSALGDQPKTASMRLDQVDPGAWSAAMAACYSWISILQSCGGGTPGTPPPVATPTPLPPPPAGAHLELEKVVFEPADPQTGGINLKALGEPWKSVEASSQATTGSASYELWGSTANYTWEVPRYLDATPRRVTISGKSKSVKNAYGHFTPLAFSIGLFGDAKFDPPPAIADGMSNQGEVAQKETSVEVRAPSLAVGSRATIKVAVNYAFSVTYHYVAANPKP